MLANQNFVVHPHIDLINRELLEVVAGRNRRLIICMPPRHGKTELANVNLGPFFLGLHPDKFVVVVSHGERTVEVWARRSRDIFEQHSLDVFGVRIDPRSTAAADWSVAGYGGGFYATTVGGALSGRPADLLIIDDPIKDHREAESPTYREDVDDWLKSTALTRLQPGGKGAVILITTRWHEDDIAGRLIEAMKHGGREWRVLSMAAIYDDDRYDDPLGRKLGEPLCAPMHSLETLLERKADLGSYFWNALYQQRPQSPQGGLFKREYFRYFSMEGDICIAAPKEGYGAPKVALRDCLQFQLIDIAAGQKTENDFFVLGTFALSEKGDVFVLDILRTKVQGPDQPGLIQQQFIRRNPEFVGVGDAEVELDMIQALARLGLPVRGIPTGGRDKRLRAIPAATKYENGQVFHLAGAPWLDDLEDELVAFDKGKHDDQVDVVGMAGRTQWPLASIRIL